MTKQNNELNPSANRSVDPLWDPQLPPDPQLQHWQDLLAPYAALSRPLRAPKPVAPVSTTRRWRRYAIGLATAAAMLLVLIGAHRYRLHWPTGQPWPLQQVSDQRELAPGEWLKTNDDQTIALDVARIGSLRLAPGSAIRLVDSRTGRHRVELEHGRVHARIWAPPGQFAISSGSMQVIDLGCEFILERKPDGSGFLSVRSGWVQQQLGGQEQLVPAGHSLHFSKDESSTALRDDAPLALRTALAALEQALQAKAGVADIEQLASAVAAVARDEDRYTLLSLLLRDPTLANGPLYPRLAVALKMPADDAAHRAAWVQRDHAAIERWWRQLPSQPKRWWAHWRDAF